MTPSELDRWLCSVVVPHGKVAGEYLPRWLAEHGVASPAAKEPRKARTP